MTMRLSLRGHIRRWTLPGHQRFALDCWLDTESLRGYLGDLPPAHSIRGCPHDRFRFRDVGHDMLVRNQKDQAQG